MNQAYEAQIVRSVDSMAQAHRNLSIAVQQLVTTLGRYVALQEKKETDAAERREESRNRTVFTVPQAVRAEPGLIGRATDPPRRPSPKRKGGR